MINQTPVAELEITKWLVNKGASIPPDLKPEDCERVESVLSVIGLARSGGIKTLVVTVSGPGGHCTAGFEVYQALRDFSASGGRVITIVKGWTASMATVISLAGDDRIMEPDAKLVLHSMLGPDPADVARMNELVLEVYSARTNTPEHLLRQALAFKDGQEIDCAAILPEDAVGFGWVHTVGSQAVTLQLVRRFLEDAQPWQPQPAAPLEVPATLCSGAKMQNDASGVAFLTCKDGMKVGTKTLEQLFALMAASNYVVGRIPAASSPAAIAETSLPRLVAVGNNFCYTSDTNGNTWISRTIPAGVYQAVIWNGSGLVAVGTNVCATSPDGITWTARTIPAGSWRYMVWTGSQFLAIRSDLNANTCATSPDGITWTARTLTAPGAGGRYSGITWGGGLFVLAGYTLAAGGNLIYTSPDGITWTQRTVPYQGGTPTVNMVSTAGYAFGQFVVWGSVSGGNVVYYSSDGITWSYTTAVPSFSPGWMAAGDKALIAVGQASVARGAVATSHDGVNWSLYDLGGIAIPFHAIWSAGYFGRARRFYVVGSAVAAATDPNFAASLALEP